MSPILVGELLVSHSVSVRKITTSDQVTGGDKNLDLVYMNPRVLYSINVFTHTLAFANFSEFESKVDLK